MSATPTNYSARFRLPTLIQRGVTQRIACPIYRDGALVAPISGTITIRDAAGALVVDAAAVSVVSSIAEYAVTTSSTIDLEEGWQVVWTFVIDAATTLTFATRPPSSSNTHPPARTWTCSPGSRR